MKRINLIFVIMIAVGAIFSCKEKELEPVLDMSQTVAPQLIQPVDGMEYVLQRDSADSVLVVFEWLPAQYALDHLSEIRYTLQIDVAGNEFNTARTLASSANTQYTLRVGKLNSELMSMGIEPGSAVDIAFRVISFINNETEQTNAYSEPVVVNATGYEDVEEVKLIYLLGSGTTIGWDNNNPLAMTPVGDGQYAIVEHLTPGDGQFIKFISVPGFWAPQWGTNDSGTPEEGLLVYRPTETEPDPAAIPVGTEEGNYYIFADTIALTYETILTSGELYLVGDATPAGWDNAAGIQFEQDNDTTTLFRLTTSLNAEGGMKFLEVPGAWAPQWGTNDKGTAEKGKLVYRPTENVEDPANIPAPASAGEYMIVVNLRTMSYEIIPQ